MILLSREKITDGATVEAHKNEVLKRCKQLPPVTSYEVACTIGHFLNNSDIIGDYAQTDKPSKPENSFETLLGHPPQKPVKVDAVMGGFIMRCKEPDYQSFFLKSNPTSIDETAGVAILDRFDIPVCVIKSPRGSARTIEFGANSKFESLDLDGVSTITLRSNEREFVIKVKYDGFAWSVDILAPNTPEPKSYAVFAGIIPLDNGTFELIFRNERLHIKSDPLTDTTISVETTSASEVKEPHETPKDLPIVKHELMHLFLNTKGLPRKRVAEDFKLKSAGTMDLTKFREKVARTILRIEIDDAIKSEFLSSLYYQSCDTDPTAIAKMLAKEVVKKGKHYNYLETYKDQIDEYIEDVTKTFELPPKFKNLVLDSLTAMYPEELLKVAQSIENFTAQFPDYAGEENTDKLVGLLAPHPFHAIPAVLRAVTRLLNDSQQPCTVNAH